MKKISGLIISYIMLMLLLIYIGCFYAFPILRQPISFGKITIGVSGRHIFYLIYVSIMISQFASYFGGNKAKKVIFIITVQLLLTLIFYELCRTVFHCFYTFETMSRHGYITIWILSIILNLCKRVRAAWSITIGNIISVILGEWIGGIKMNYNMSLITDTMDAEKRYLLSLHPGDLFYFLFMFFVVLLAIVLEVIYSKNRRANNIK